MRYEWTESAARHGISRARVRHVLDTAPRAHVLAGADGEPDETLLLFVADDPNGVPLEVVVRVGDGVVMVIHAMRLRAKYRHLYDGSR